jgi:Polyphosphate kinase 2 (PPK2)
MLRSHRIGQSGIVFRRSELPVPAQFRAARPALDRRQGHLAATPPSGPQDDLERSHRRGGQQCPWDSVGMMREIDLEALSTPEHGYTVDDDEDDPVLLDGDGNHVDTWLELYPYDQRMPRDEYEPLKRRLQIELLKLQKDSKRTGARHVILFEGRDAAGKGGTIQRFMEQAPLFEQMLVGNGINLTKLWFSISPAEQRTRFAIRLVDPVRQWKFSPMDMESVNKGGRLHRGEGGHVRSYRRRSRSVARGQKQRQKAGPHQRHALRSGQMRLCR